MRPYTLSKKLLLNSRQSRYVAILFNLQLSLFKDRIHSSRGEQVRSIPFPSPSTQGGNHTFYQLSSLNAGNHRLRTSLATYQEADFPTFDSDARTPPSKGRRPPRQCGLFREFPECQSPSRQMATSRVLGWLSYGVPCHSTPESPA